MKKILIVDDNLFVQKSLASLFFEEKETSTVEIDFASDGEEAFEKVNSEKMDLIILDYQMPKMNGIEFLRAVQGISIPIMMVSGAFDEELKKEAKQLGALAFFDKPLKDFHLFHQEAFKLLKLEAVKK